MKIIKSSDFQKAREIIKKTRKSENIKIVFSGTSDEINRKILEKESIDILLIELKKRKDRQKQRDSGLNQVIAKIAKKKQISIGINLDEIIESPAKEKSKIISRIRQNIMLCNKNKINMKFISEKPENHRDKRSLIALGLVLGMPTWMTKNI